MRKLTATLCLIIALLFGHAENIYSQEINKFETFILNDALVIGDSNYEDALSKINIDFYIYPNKNNNIKIELLFKHSLNGEKNKRKFNIKLLECDISGGLFKQTIVAKNIKDFCKNALHSSLLINELKSKISYQINLLIPRFGFFNTDLIFKKSYDGMNYKSTTNISSFLTNSSILKSISDEIKLDIKSIGDEIELDGVISFVKKSSDMKISTKNGEYLKVKSTVNKNKLKNTIYNDTYKNIITKELSKTALQFFKLFENHADIMKHSFATDDYSTYFGLKEVYPDRVLNEEYFSRLYQHFPWLYQYEGYKIKGYKVLGQSKIKKRNKVVIEPIIETQRPHFKEDILHYIDTNTGIISHSNATFHLQEGPMTVILGMVLDTEFSEKVSNFEIKSKENKNISIQGLKKGEEKCLELGFIKGTEKFGDCVVKLLPIANELKGNEKSIPKRYTNDLTTKQPLSKISYIQRVFKKGSKVCGWTDLKGNSGTDYFYKDKSKFSGSADRLIGDNMKQGTWEISGNAINLNWHGGKKGKGRWYKVKETGKKSFDLVTHDQSKIYQMQCR